MKKLYYAPVAIEVASYFESKANDIGATIVARIINHTSDTNEPYYGYLLEAEKGIIDPKYEFKD